MIRGFEKETEDLNEQEVRLSHLIALTLDTRVGLHNALTNNQLCEVIEFHHGLIVSPSKMRKIINHIRRNKLVKNLIANTKGYFVSKDREEIIEYVKSLYERIDAIKEVAESFDVNVNQKELWTS